MTESRVRTGPKNFHNDEPYFLNLTEFTTPTNINLTPDVKLRVKVCRFHKVCRFQIRSNSIIKVRHCHGLVKFIRSS